MTCAPVYKVSVTVTGGTITNVNFIDDTLGANHELDHVSSASVLLAKGTFVDVELQSGDMHFGGGKPFTYTCPGGLPQSATAAPASISGTYYEDIPNDCVVNALSSDYAITASFSG